MNILKSIKKFLKSRIFSNLLNQTLVCGFSYIVPLILVPFLFNTIGVEKYGQINFALAFSFYFQVFNEFGFNLSNVRHVVKYRDDNKKLSEIFSAIIQCKLILLCISGIIFFPIVLCLDAFKGEFVIYFLAFVRCFGIVLLPVWLFSSMEEFKYITRITLLIKVILTLPIFIFVHSPNDYIVVMFCYASECLVSGVVGIIIAVKHYKLSLKIQRIKTLIYYFKDSMPFFVSTFLQRIYQNSNSVFIGFLFGDAAVGVYTAAEKLYSAYASFFSPIITRILYPYFQRIKSIARINKVVIIITLTNFIILSVLAVGSPYVIGYVIKNMNDEIIHYFYIFLLILAISVPNEIIGFPYLGVLGKVNEVTKSIFMSAVSYFIIIGICLIFFQSINMFVIALLIAHFIGFVYRVICIYKINKNVKINYSSYDS